MLKITPVQEEALSRAPLQSYCDRLRAYVADDPRTAEAADYPDQWYLDSVAWAREFRVTEEIDVADLLVLSVVVGPEAFDHPDAQAILTAPGRAGWLKVSQLEYLFGGHRPNA
jgi:hypothetical protein